MVSTNKKSNAVISLSQFVALDPQTVAALPAALNGDQENIQTIDQVVNRMIAAPVLDGTRTVVVLDPNGNIIDRSFHPGGWKNLPCLYRTGIGVSCRLLPRPWHLKKPIVSTEVIPADLSGPGRPG